MRDGAPRSVGDGKADADPPHQWREQSAVPAIPSVSVLTVCVERCDHRDCGLLEDKPWHQRHERLVHVQHVESPRAKQIGDAPPRTWIETKTRFSAADDE